MEEGITRPTVDELAVSQAWNAGWFRPEALQTSDGRPITVVYRGRWTFGFGLVMARTGVTARNGTLSLFLAFFSVCPGRSGAPRARARDTPPVVICWGNRLPRADSQHGGNPCPERLFSLLSGDNHSLEKGPDFRGALIAFGAELRRGDVEIHLRGAGWREHGHHLNPAYNEVILHVVLDGDLREQTCRRQDGAVISTLVLRPVLRGPLEALPVDPALVALGARTEGQCIATVTPATSAAALAAIERAGDARLTAKAAGYEALFTAGTPGQALYAGLLDALGYTRNREPMAALAAALPLAAIESRLPPRDPVAAGQLAAALLLGVGGFLPFTSATATLSGLSFAERDAIECAWAEAGAPWRGVALPPERWMLARVRPANHPLRRLLGAAALLVRCGRAGLLGACLEPATAEEPAVGLAELRALLLGPTRPADPFGRYIGADRVAEMINNIILPFILAYGAWAEDERLSGGAAALWEVTPSSGGNEPTRALLAQIAGGAALKLKTGRQQQGALHLFRHFCEHRRCFECPIARLGRGES